MLTRDDVVNVNYVVHSEFNLLPNLASWYPLHYQHIVIKGLRHDC